MLTYLTAGESHGPQLTVIVDGLPANLPIDLEQLDFQLTRRQKGYGRGGRMKIESDAAQLVGGVRHGKTIGGPVAVVIANRDWENWSDIMHPVQQLPEKIPLKKQRLARETSCPRPGHADLAGGIKWHHHDLRNVLERASARETAARTAAGALARQLLSQFDIKIASHVVRIGEVSLGKKRRPDDLDQIAEMTEKSEVRCLDKSTGEKMMSAIRTAKKKRDSLGGIVEVIIRGVPVGLGGLSQWYQRLDGRLAAAVMAVHSCKGVEIGAGFQAGKMPGSTFQDEIFYDVEESRARKGFYRKSNNAGGIEGGMSNGEDIVIRAVAKPISTLNQPLQSVDVRTKQPAEAMVERTDNCVVPAFSVICEAVAAFVIAEAFLEKFGSDNIDETRRNYDNFLKADY